MTALYIRNLAYTSMLAKLFMYTKITNHKY